MSHRIKLTLCGLKFNDPNLSFDDWECDQIGIQCKYCYIKQDYDSNVKHKERAEE